MKMNKQKIIVSTLALAMGAALAGSVSGTVAWFQYSTRAQGTYIGLSTHCSEMLEISANEGAFASEISGISSKSGYGTALTPISTGALAENAALPLNNQLEDFYKNPVYQIADSATWGKAGIVNYAQFTLDFHVRDVNTGNAKYLGDHNLYLTNIEIVSLADSAGAATTDLHDLHRAVRVHISSGSYEATFAAGDGTAATVDTIVHGNLDLNGDGNLDQTKGYSWTADRELVDYGNPSNTEYTAQNEPKQVAYDVNYANNFADDDDPSSLDDSIGAPGFIGAITEDQEKGITLTVTIWLEGWTQLGEQTYTADEATAYNAAHQNDEGFVAVSEGDVKVADNAVWDASTYIGKNFGVGLRFGTELHDDTHQ